jgi:hypothetical protein
MLFLYVCVSVCVSCEATIYFRRKTCLLCSNLFSVQVYIYFRMYKPIEPLRQNSGFPAGRKCAPGLANGAAAAGKDARPLPYASAGHGEDSSSAEVQLNCINEDDGYSASCRKLFRIAVVEEDARSFSLFVGRMLTWAVALAALAVVPSMVAALTMHGIPDVTFTVISEATNRDPSRIIMTVGTIVSLPPLFASVALWHLKIAQFFARSPSKGSSSKDGEDCAKRRRLNSNVAIIALGGTVVFAAGAQFPLNLYGTTHQVLVGVGFAAIAVWCCFSEKMLLHALPEHVQYLLSVPANATTKENVLGGVRFASSDGQTRVRKWLLRVICVSAVTCFLVSFIFLFYDKGTVPGHNLEFIALPFAEYVLLLSVGLYGIMVSWAYRNMTIDVIW